MIVLVDWDQILAFGCFHVKREGFWELNFPGNLFNSTIFWGEAGNVEGCKSSGKV